MVEFDRFEHAPQMLCVGIRRHHAFADAPEGIRRQWEDFGALGAIPGARGSAAYGIMCGASAGSFEYMCAVEVESFEDAPRELGRIRIPAQEYAVFTVRDAALIPQSWMAIWQEWIPRSGHTLANTPEFERYAGGVATGGPDPDVEIWASIHKDGAK